MGLTLLKQFSDAAKLQSILNWLTWEVIKMVLPLLSDIVLVRPNLHPSGINICKKI